MFNLTLLITSFRGHFCFLYSFSLLICSVPSNCPFTCLLANSQIFVECLPWANHWSNCPGFNYIKKAICALKEHGVYIPSISINIPFLSKRPAFRPPRPFVYHVFIKVLVCSGYHNKYHRPRNITLPRKVCLVKAMVFPVVMYGCESWTVKKAER